MAKRKENLLKKDAFVSGIYLDQRFNFTSSPFLSEEQKRTAVEHLLKTNTIIKRLTGQHEETQHSSILSNDPATPTVNFSKLEAKMN
ncbi:hypothetical protein FF38_09057 [Lucilia cuprina]|uniref:Uncharacterized protein n=1 Tax=Lucilia cuprina TaxID=7375 RepID=A0A0L0CPB9_LUCCU|nr:hypothetical protein FF38_09057 [Lucilia cuprina]